MTGLSESLQAKHPLVLDGAVGTELARRGFTTDRAGWASAATLEAPELLADIHQSYVAAGADLITANTFRTHRSSLADTGIDAREVTSRGVEIAKSVSPRFLLGSAGPIADCYEPEATPRNDVLRREHDEHIGLLLDAGVDGLLFETMPTSREACIACELAVATGLPTLVSLWCADWKSLGEGESVVDTVAKLFDLGADAVLFNCFAAVDGEAGKLITSATRGRWGAYANAGLFSDGEWQTTEADDPSFYRLVAADWVDAGACIIGGCCGTTPAHVSSLRQLVDSLTHPDCSP